jgi:hypothetical protein
LLVKQKISKPVTTNHVGWLGKNKFFQKRKQKKIQNQDFGAKFQTQPASLPEREERTQAKSLCTDPIVNGAPETEEFTAYEKAMVETGRARAKEMVFSAINKVLANDPAVSKGVKSVFNIETLSRTYILNALVNIRDLIDKVKVEKGSCNHHNCNNADARSEFVSAYVPSGAVGLFGVCPLMFHFEEILISKIRNLFIHECGHLAKIDSDFNSDTKIYKEEYCDIKSADESGLCPGVSNPLLNVDAWSYFIVWIVTGKKSELDPPYGDD